jgi:hypothetical protein
MVFVQGELAVAGKVSTLFFPCGRIIKVLRSGYKVTNATNPFTVGANITLPVVDCCAPPPLKLAVSCTTFFVLLASTLMAPTPVGVGATVHYLGEIYDKY